jgi:hypothetical protein
MGKRSEFQRRDRDFYPTPEEALLPLLDHIENYFTFIEPCAGDGQLTTLLMKYSSVEKRNVLDIFVKPEYYITNPPWERKLLHQIIQHLSDLAPTWLLFDADWIHTKQSQPYQSRLKKIVSVGRVKWIPDSKMTGKDNCSWYLFDKNNMQETVIVGNKRGLSGIFTEQHPILQGMGQTRVYV